MGKGCGSSVPPLLCFLPSLVDAVWCHLAEDSGLAGSQPLAEAGSWSSCYVLLLSKGFASFLSLENTYRDCRTPQKQPTPPGAAHFSCQGLGQQLGPLGLKGLHRVELHISEGTFLSIPFSQAWSSVASGGVGCPLALRGSGGSWKGVMST